MVDLSHEAEPTSVRRVRLISEQKLDILNECKIRERRDSTASLLEIGEGTKRKWLCSKINVTVTQHIIEEKQSNYSCYGTTKKLQSFDMVQNSAEGGWEDSKCSSTLNRGGLMENQELGLMVPQFRRTDFDQIKFQSIVKQVM